MAFSKDKKFLAPFRDDLKTDNTHLELADVPLFTIHVCNTAQ